MAPRSLRLYGSFAAALLGIVIACTATVLALQEWKSSNDWLTHSYEVRDAIERVLSDAIECEAALRGVLLTGQDAPLLRFRAHERTLRPGLDDLRELVADNPLQSARAAHVAQVAAEMLARMNANLDSRAPGAPQYVHELRTALAELRDAEAELMAVRRTLWIRQQRRALFTAIGGSLLLLLLAGLAGIVVRGDLRRREQVVRDRAALYQFQERLLAIVGHDLRNPLTAVLISTQMLLKKRDELQENQRLALERIARSAARIDALGNLLVDFTHARLAGGVPVRREPSDARLAVERALDELRSVHPDRAITLEVRTPRTQGSFDAERIAQLTGNLVSNAVRYGTRSSAVQVLLEDGPGDLLVLAVHNDGPPIEPALIPHLFEPYRRGDAASRSYAQGLGLGLYIVREIALAHGGSVEVRSEPAGGTAFRVLLPR